MSHADPYLSHTIVMAVINDFFPFPRAIWFIQAKFALEVSVANLWVPLLLRSCVDISRHFAAFDFRMDSFDCHPTLPSSNMCGKSSMCSLENWSYRFTQKQLEDDYVQKEQLGKGTYGVVYSCWHKYTNTTRAVKMVNLSALKSMLLVFLATCTYLGFVV